MRSIKYINWFSSTLDSGLNSSYNQQRNNILYSYDIYDKYSDAVRPLPQTVNRFHFYPSPNGDACCPAIMTRLRGSFGIQGRPGLALGHSTRYLFHLPRGRHSSDSLLSGSDNDCLRELRTDLFLYSITLKYKKLSHHYSTFEYKSQALTKSKFVIEFKQIEKRRYGNHY